MQMDSNFLNKAKFTNMVEDLVHRDGLSYLDAIIELCEQNQIDLADAKKFINPNIKSKLEAEAMDLNFIPRTAQLPDV